MALGRGWGYFLRLSVVPSFIAGVFHRTEMFIPYDEFVLQVVSMVTIAPYGRVQLESSIVKPTPGYTASTHAQIPISLRDVVTRVEVTFQEIHSPKYNNTRAF